MNLQPLLAARIDANKPVRAGLIGAGKFGSMFLAQVPSIKGLEVAVIADLDPERAQAACRTVGWDTSRIARTRFVSDGREACGDERVEVVIEATGSPAAGIAHALTAFETRKHIVMVNVEADTLAGAYLAGKARAAGVVYSMAYGDQPALIAEMVDWARSAGFEVAAAGKGTKYLPAYHSVTPDGVWDALRAHRRRSQSRRHEPADVQFLSRRHQVRDRDGRGRQCLRARRAAGRSAFSALWRRRSGARATAALARRRARRATAWWKCCHRWSAMVRAVARDLRWGVYVVLKAQNDYAAACFKQYGLPTDVKRPLCRDVQAVSSDRARAVDLGAERGAARRSRPARAGPGAATRSRLPSVR